MFSWISKKPSKQKKNASTSDFLSEDWDPDQDLDPSLREDAQDEFSDTAIFEAVGKASLVASEEHDIGEVELTEEDQNDPELLEGLRELGYESDPDEKQRKLDALQAKISGLELRIKELKSEAVAFNKRGDRAEALKILRQSKLAEAELETLQKQREKQRALLLGGAATVGGAGAANGKKGDGEDELMALMQQQDPAPTESNDTMLINMPSCVLDATPAPPKRAVTPPAPPPVAAPAPQQQPKATATVDLNMDDAPAPPTVVITTTEATTVIAAPAPAPKDNRCDAKALVGRYKQEALRFKRSGDVTTAKRFLKTAKEIECELGTSSMSTFIDLERYPNPLEDPNEVAYLTIERSLREQTDTADDQIKHAHETGDRLLLAKWQKEKAECVRLLERVVKMRAMGSPAPAHAFGHRERVDEVTVPRLADNECEIHIVRAFISNDSKSNAKSNASGSNGGVGGGTSGVGVGGAGGMGGSNAAKSNVAFESVEHTYVHYEYSWPADTTQRGDTRSVARRQLVDASEGSSALSLSWDYDHVIKLQLDRKSKKATLEKFFAKKKVALELWHHRFLRSTCIGVAEVPLDECLTKCEVVQLVNVLHPTTRQRTGAQVEVRVSLRTPIAKKEHVTILQKVIEIDFSVAFDHDRKQREREKSAITTQPLAAPPPSTAAPPSPPPVVEAPTVAQKQRQQPKATLAPPPPPTEDDPDLAYVNSVDAMMHSTYLMQWECQRLQSQLASDPTMAPDVREELENRKEALEIQMQMLAAQVEAGLLSQDVYESRVKQQILAEKQRAIQAKKAGKKDIAVLLLKRAKIMEQEIEEMNG